MSTDWNQGRIDDEENQKANNIKTRDRLTKELEDAETLAGIKQKQCEETQSKLNVQRGKNSKLQNIVVAAEKGNQQIKNTLENCREQLNAAL